MSAGFLKVARTPPEMAEVVASHPGADVLPLTETIAIESTEKADGTSTWTQPISSPPLLLPMFWTLIVIAVATPTVAVNGDPANVHSRAASAA